MKKVVPEYDLFPINKATAAEAKCVGKVVGGFSIKKGRQQCFVAKKPYFDPSLCMLVYNNTMHAINTAMDQWSVDSCKH